MHIRKKEGLGGGVKGGGREEMGWILPPCVAHFEEKEESLEFLANCLERGEGRGEGRVGYVTFLRETPRYAFIFLFFNLFSVFSSCSVS